MEYQLITQIDEVDRLLPTWLDQDFAFDLETTGLSYDTDRILGTSLTFADGRTYYICASHTIPEQEVTRRTRVEDRLIGYEEYEYTTPKGKVKIKQRPLYEKMSVEYNEEVTLYPTKKFIGLRDLASRLRPLFAQFDVVMVAHNLKFDMHFLRRIGIALNGKLADTLLAAQLIDENRSVGLKELSHLVGLNLAHYQDLDHYPGFRKEEFLSVPLDQAAQYAALDTYATYMLWERFSVELVEEGVDACFRDLWMPLLFVLQQMEARGIALDLDKVRDMRERYVKQQAEADAAIFAEGIEYLLERYPDAESRATIPATSSLLRMATDEEVALAQEHEDGSTWTWLDEGFPSPLIQPTPRSKPRVFTFNPGSNDHLGMLVYDKHRLRPPKGLRLAKTNGGRSVDKNTIKTIALALGDKAPPLLDHIQMRRKAEKLVSTYLDRFLELADPNDHNCIRTSFNQAKTATGRLSSSSPINLNCRAISR